MIKITAIAAMTGLLLMMMICFLFWRLTIKQHKKIETLNYQVETLLEHVYRSDDKTTTCPMQLINARLL